MNPLKTPVLACSFAFAFVFSAVQGATNIFHVTGGNGINYVIDGVNDPTNLTLVRGFTYFFDVNVSAIHPFFIRTPAGTNLNEADGVTNNGATSAVIVFDVPLDAPDELKYQCGVHAGMTGPLHILGPPTVYITDLSIGSNVVIQSTGYDSDILNLRILSGTSLTNMPWTEAVLLSNTYSNGTNLTEVAVPPEDAQFFRIEQGFF